VKTNFKDYLKKKKTQDVINKVARLYDGKNVVLYGAGLFAGDLIRNYDLSELNIVGVADKAFEDNCDDEYYEYKKIAPSNLLENDFDLLLVIVYDDTSVKAFLRKDLLRGKDVKFKIKSLIKLNLFEYINALIKGEL